MSDNTEKTSDQKLAGQLAAQIAALNPCSTTSEIMEMVTEEMKERNSQNLVSKESENA